MNSIDKRTKIMLGMTVVALVFSWICVAIAYSL